ncbi:dibenzothiophene desulfurase [Rhodobacteraceae bacterium PD-2]|nr:dibenzothiophene desulfurase [Rhodobacteraceae bacterium PD-2]
MHPARSLILFTTLSGLGFGLLIWLGIDPSPPMGWVGAIFYALAFALALGGLAASAFHLGHPERALRAFTQWRSSWLSREACLSVAALTVSGLHAAALVLFGIHIAPLGGLSALLCLATITATAMIYTQLRTVPRWHHWSTPALFALTGLAGGALLSGRTTAAALLLAATGLAQLGWWLGGDRREATDGSTRATATGLGARGAVRPFEPPHTGDSYLTREMAFVVARKHARKLRMIALVLMAGLPALLLLAAPGHVNGALALLMHLAGTLVARWLVFAEARHVMALYYPPRVER